MRGGLSPCQLGCNRRTETCDQLLEDAKAKPRTLLGVFVLILGLLVALPVSAAVAGDTRPNIVVLMIDDLAVLRDQRLWNRLPHIKSLFVDHGITFKHAIGETSLCCPGRAGFLGGQHTRHHGVTYNDARLFDPTNTIATALHDAGYTTLLSGKYLNLMDLLDNRFPPGWDHFAGIGDGYYDYDEFKQLSRVQDAAGNVLELSYDENGNLKQLLDGRGKETHFYYDQRDRLVQKSYPQGNYETWSYDAWNNVAAHRDPPI